MAALGVFGSRMQRMRRKWEAGSNPSVLRHIDELCAFLSDIKQRAKEGTYGGGAA